MTATLRQGIAPTYLLACLILGGSGQGVWGPLVLQLIGVALLGSAFWADPKQALGTSARQIGWIMAAVVLLILLQLVPLPPAFWTALPGREAAVVNLCLLGEPLPWLPISLAPYDSLAAALALIPPLALLAAILRLGAYRAGWLALAIGAGAVLNILLGALQISTGRYYLFPFSTVGSASGFFANGNYLGTLLLAAIPFLAALTAQGMQERRSHRKRVGSLGLALGPLLVLVMGLVISKSMAALMLTVPIALASSLLLFKDNGRRWIAVGLLAVGCALIAVLAYSQLPAINDPNNALSTDIRRHLYGKTAEIAWQLFPVGSGLGSFPRVYALYEDPGVFFGAMVNHAHEEYLEIAMEGGLAGLLILAAFFWWWFRRLGAIWRSPASTVYERAGTIASAAILAHSLVDFPARTMAVASVLATAVALMAEPREWRKSEGGTTERRAARHVSLR
ncbi:O-antigen ligase family protein [Sphingomonas sp. KRR8]|uniref:O-antigen ligase family protein n=1 Tax=Sphingomonas sp. KRR8 TaxID=2942996 RepID=UPI002021A942|nr:O-antigen ligase family protein [Sphingomonas sp. KRR8]URD61690.1 O-antigen ligase family protein [Sphingomonas sp. KRR8]